jgi:two-component system NarL family response regulator
LWNVLIVDDNAMVRQLIAEIMTPIAMEIRECTDGGDALPAYDALKPDVVLMDVRMKQVDGIEATRRIRKVHPSAKVIIVTDLDDDAVRQAARSAGACGYALKDNLLDLPGLVESLV